jgi:hypothetical protein
LRGLQSDYTAGGRDPLSRLGWPARYLEFALNRAQLRAPALGWKDVLFAKLGTLEPKIARSCSDLSRLLRSARVLASQVATWHNAAINAPRDTDGRRRQPAGVEGSQGHKVAISRAWLHGHGWARTSDLSRVKRYCIAAETQQKSCKAATNSTTSPLPKTC